ncbi:MAG: hypothetical protein M1838_004545 [Thelocarpon superellum]|nr:MAG: hypothetical protein M1838_004545 [Thelocarpon superellum]
MLGAVIYEQLRVYSPVINFPKHVATGDQVVMRDGQQIKIPNGTFIHLSNYTIHRDPRYYPHQPSSRTGASHDLQDFVPQRWLLPESHPDKARSRLYTPPPGAFIPFSDGQRACLGRRFAMVELTAALAAIFQHYSVELAVDQWASDEEVASLSPAERRALHQRAIDSAYEKLDDGWDVVVTTKLKKGSEIPIRFVRRGMERFRFD